MTSAAVVGRKRRARGRLVDRSNADDACAPKPGPAKGGKPAAGGSMRPMGADGGACQRTVERGDADEKVMGITQRRDLFNESLVEPIKNPEPRQWSYLG